MRNIHAAILMTFLAGITTYCGKKDSDSSDDSATEDETTVAAGEQPDSEAGRFTPPPDTTEPLEPSAFSVAGGSKLGEVLLMLGYPDHIDDYARIDIHRAAGTVAPTECDEDTLVTSITDFSDQTWLDSGLYPGSYHSYLACVYDEAGNVIKTESLSKGRATDRQRVFVSSAQYTGNLKADFQGKSFTSGLAGADARCQYHADQAKLGGTWRALLGTQANPVKVRNPVFGGIYNTKGERITANLNTFWSGRLENAVRYDESGNLVDDDESEAESSQVWTGIQYNGRIEPMYTCNNWDSTAAYGRAGSSLLGPDTDTGYRWSSYYNGSCAQEAHLYCLEYVGETFATPKLTATANATVGLVDVAVDFAGVSANMHTMKIFREAGSNFDNYDCYESYRNRLATTKLYSTTSVTAVADETIQDDVDTDYPYDDNAEGEHGPYHWYACAYDAYGNVNSVSTASSATVGTDWLKSFLSDGTFDGDTLSQADANTECTTTASTNSITGSFKAFLSDNTVTAVNNIGTTNGRLIYDLLGNYVGEIRQGGGMEYTNPVRSLADSTAADFGTSAWTGTYYWGGQSSNCSNWSSNDAGSYGAISQINGYPTTYSTYTTTCDNQLKVVCVEAN